MSFPPPIAALKLRVSTGSDTYEQSIPSASLGNNSMQIMPNTVVFNAFNNNPAGTIFNPSIVTSYGSDELGNGLSMVSTPSVVANFVPNQIIPALSIANISNKLTIDSHFYLSDFITTNSGGGLSYSSSAPSVATVNSSTGQVTIVGVGTTIITVNLAATANGQFAAATVTTSLIVSLTKGFYEITDSEFVGLDFDSGMTTLFTNQDEDVKPITMPNSEFMFNNIEYTTLYASSNGWFYFGTVAEQPIEGLNNFMPVTTFRPFGGNHISTGSYKFTSDNTNTKLLFKLTGYPYGAETKTKTFTIKVIIKQSGEIRTNYTFSPTFTSNSTIGFFGASTIDDTPLTLDGVTFNGTSPHDFNHYSLLNAKTILFIPYNYSTFGTFTLPSDILVYQNQTITRVLTPPTSNSLGAFTFTSSNSAVATITVDSNGVSSINVIGAGITKITAIQAASGNYAISSIALLLNTVTGTVIKCSQIADSDFTGLDFVSGVSVLAILRPGQRMSMA
jgi:hypothetical protein